MKVEKLERGAILIWAGSTVTVGADIAPSPLMVEVVGDETTRVLTHTGETLDMPNEKLEHGYDVAPAAVSEKARKRYWKDR
jgi:hypothetical protein